MPRRVLIPAGLFLYLPVASLKVPAQSNVSPKTPTPPSAPAPLLSPEGNTDENGWTWPGTEWKQVSPESEGFSAERLEALRSFLKTHHGRNNHFWCPSSVNDSAIARSRSRWNKGRKHWCSRSATTSLCICTRCRRHTRRVFNASNIGASGRVYKVLGGFYATSSGNGSFAGGVFPYLLGPRVNSRRGKFTPFVQALFGGARTTDGIAQSTGTENSFAMTMSVKV
jgi:hypothetical protein